MDYFIYTFTITCLLYKYNHSKIHDKKRPNKNTIKILLNILFVQDDQETNEEITKQCANRRNIIAQYENLLTISLWS